MGTLCATGRRRHGPVCASRQQLSVMARHGWHSSSSGQPPAWRPRLVLWLASPAPPLLHLLYVWSAQGGGGGLRLLPLQGHPSSVSGGAKSPQDAVRSSYASQDLHDQSLLVPWLNGLKVVGTDLERRAVCALQHHVLLFPYVSSMQLARQFLRHCVQPHHRLTDVAPGAQISEIRKKQVWLYYLHCMPDSLRVRHVFLSCALEINI